MLDLRTINNLSPKVGFFRYQEISPGRFLLTNEIGRWCFLGQDDFQSFLTGRLDPRGKLYRELAEKLFIIEPDEEAYVQKMAEKYWKKNIGLTAGPSLHIIVLTRRCNQACVYCHASSRNLKPGQKDLNTEIAQGIVDFVFQSNNHYIGLEFQGGEPLLNWDVLKFLVDYALEKNKLFKRNLKLSLVSNLSLLDKEKRDFLIKRGVDICTSLDGDEQSHNYSRPLPGQNGFQVLAEKIKELRLAYRDTGDKRLITGFKRGALLTVTRQTMAEPEKVIDAYRDLGFEAIYLRYLNPFGFALKQPDYLYSAQEFLEFYGKTLDYILELNKKGEFFIEKISQIYLTKILTERDPNDLDRRSPCGAGTGNLAYDYNGDIYTCDEGRMLAAMGDDTFKLGNVAENNLEDVINCPACKATCLASCIDGLPGYDDDVFKPYLGLCPVYHYSVYQNLFPQMSQNRRWQMDRGVVKYLFEKIRNPENLKIFKTWLD